MFFFPLNSVARIYARSVKITDLVLLETAIRLTDYGHVLSLEPIPLMYFFSATYLITNEFIENNNTLKFMCTQ